MRARLLLSFLLATAASAVVVDRIAVIVEKRVIKTSDIEREVRVTQFLNAEPLDLGTEARKQAAERLIDQAIIRREIEAGGYSMASEEDAARMLEQVKKERSGSAAAKYGLTEDQLLRHLRWQVTVECW